MNDVTSISIPAKLLNRIASRLPQPTRVSPLWPFWRQQTAAENGPAHVPGVTGADGEPTAGTAALLAQLRDVRGFVRTAVGAHGRFTETIVYFPLQGDPVLLQPGPDALQFTVPAPVDDVVAALAAQLGVSAAAMGDFAVELSAAEALVLAAVIDNQRRHVLQELAASRIPERAFVDAGATRAALSAGTGSAQWLAPIVAGMAGEEEAPAMEAVLDSLRQTGLLQVSGGGYLPSEAVWNVARRMPLIDRVCAVSAGREADGAVVVTGFTGVVSGIFHLLHLESADGRIRFRTPSPREVLAEVEYLLKNPEALKPLAETLPAEEPPGLPQSAAGSVCQACGSALPEGDAFCGRCGQAARQQPAPPAPPAPAYCRQCGQGVESGAKFCRTCGTAVKF